MKNGLIYFFPSFCSCLAFFFIEWTFSIFTTPLPFGAVYFLKISKSFQFLTCFNFHGSFSTSSKAFKILQECHPLAEKGSHNLVPPHGTSLLGSLSHFRSLLWLWSPLTSSWLPAGESWLSFHPVAFLIAFFCHMTCAAFRSPWEMSSTWHII